ncbi:SPOSA6832_02019 [Sporobolomyces salmonicolor]|uniref:Large ribosomal subunit protein mL45 n=1 Tax=Sporidiobolus salmonicolor TaxID=5005 RepID=A0A0D6EK72_SPOSA|nr:SPOSA6832_02019 [Sporobolomyces salmonicolor]
MRQVQPSAHLAAGSLLARPSSLLTAAFQAHRTYATANNAQAELQKKQIRMAEKAGRMKQNMAAVAAVPIFANHIRPVKGRVPSTNATWRKYAWADGMNVVYSRWIRLRWRKLLGDGWFKRFEERALVTYQLTNQALATGNYEKMREYAANNVIDSIKAQRTRKLQGLRLSWRLHNVIEQKVVCVRQQEIFKKDENIGQMVVRFVTNQSLEIRDAQGRLVGSGSHENPEAVTEYLIFQRDMWRPDDEWKCVKKGARETDTIVNPADQP